MEAKSKAPGTKRLRPKYDELLSNFAFNINLRRYILALQISDEGQYAKTCKMTHPEEYERYKVWAAAEVEAFGAAQAAAETAGKKAGLQHISLATSSITCYTLDC